MPRRDVRLQGQSRTVFDYNPNPKAPRHPISGGALLFHPMSVSTKKAEVSLNRPGGFVSKNTTQDVDLNAYSDVVLGQRTSKQNPIPLPKSFRGRGAARNKNVAEKKNNIKFLF